MAIAFFGECPHKVGSKISRDWNDVMRKSVARALKQPGWNEKKLEKVGG
jgi:hypothetical protein